MHVCVLRVPPTLHPPGPGCVAEPLVRMQLLAGAQVCPLQPGRARKPERKNVLRAEKGKPLHIDSCVWKPRRKQKRCKPVVLWLEITKESRLGLQGGARKVGCLSPKISLKVGNVGLFTD